MRLPMRLPTRLPTRLHLVRHLAPQAAPGLCYGRSDLAVDPALLAAALPALRAQLPADAPVFSSPLVRCAALAEQLAPGTVRYDARLIELDFGSWEMRAWDDIARAQVDAWAADVVHYRPGGGESVAAMALRIDAFYREVTALPAAVVVCHAGAMRLLAARARGLDPERMADEAAARPHAIAYGAVMQLDCV